jgi:hypothetical protein
MLKSPEPASESSEAGDAERAVRLRIDLAASQPCAGTGWTDDGASREERGLKHRAPGETRSIPIPPVLVAMLRAHIARYGTSPGGHLFRTARGGPLNDTGWGEVWQRARPVALTAAQEASPLARRPYDLRHAAVSPPPVRGGPPPRRPPARFPGLSTKRLCRTFGGDGG